MSLSLITGTGDGVTRQYAISFALGFISRNDVTMRVNNEVDGGGNPVYRTITWINDGLISIAVAPALGVPWIIERTVSKTVLIHNYSNGEAIEESNLDDSNKQTLMAVQEFIDGRIDAPLFNDLDMGTHKVINLANGVAPADAVNKAQLDAVEGVAGGAQAAADAAAASAVQAAAYVAGLTATSSTSNTPAGGLMTFTIQSGKLFIPGQILILSSAAMPTTYVHGNVVTYSGTTLVMNVTDFSGTGAHADWNISISGTLGTPGNLPAQASNTFTGNNTGGSAVPFALTTAQAKTMLAIARTDVSGLGSLASQSGTFSGTSSGTNTGDQTNIAGNSATATKLATARNINGVPFDGTTDITVPSSATVVFDQTLTTSSGFYVGVDMSSFSLIELTFSGMTKSTNSGPHLQFSNTVGSGAFNGATDYFYIHTGASGSSSAGRADILIGDDTLSYDFEARVTIHNLGDANSKTIIDQNVWMPAGLFIYQGMGGRNTASAEKDIRIFPSAGTFSGRIKVVGYK